MDPEHRKWINRKLRKRRASRKTTAPSKPPEVVKPAEPDTPSEPPVAPEETMQTASPIVRPGHIVQRALRPRMEEGGSSQMPRRGWYQ
jgi:hypothetical protein